MPIVGTHLFLKLAGVSDGPTQPLPEHDRSMSDANAAQQSEPAHSGSQGSGTSHMQDRGSAVSSTRGPRLGLSCELSVPRLFL